MEVGFANGTRNGIAVVPGKHVSDVAPSPVFGVHVSPLFEEHDIAAELKSRKGAHALSLILVDLKGPVSLLLFLQLSLNLCLPFVGGVESSLTSGGKDFI